MKRIASLSLWLLVLLMAIGTTVIAQTGTTGDLAGTVKDSSDAIVIGATVNLKNWDTGETRTTTTGPNGSYRFSFLKPGSYQVSAKTAGLLSDFAMVKVEVGQAASLDLVAKVQSTQAVIEVSANAGLVQSENANLATTFDIKEIESQPLPGGDITGVAYTVAGVVMSTGAGYGAFSSHGLPATSNLFTVNGNDNMDPYLNLNNSGASNLTLGQNEIAEAAVVQNGYSVQYGRQAGAQVNYITKSGTNEFHGNLSYQWNGTRLNANDFFNNMNGVGRPRAISNQWGDSIGGPIKKNKTFFYFDNEGLYYTLPASGYVVVPSPQLQNYILTQVSAAQTPFYQKAFGIWNGAPGMANAVPTTTGNGPLQDSSGNLGCGFGSFGAVNGNPTALGFGSTVPCTVGYATNGSNTNREWLMVGRVDHNINDKQKLSFRYKQDKGLQPTSTDLVNSTFSAISVQPSYEGQATHTYVISPQIVNNFIGASSWYSALFGPADIQKAYATFPLQMSILDGSGPNAAGISSIGVATNMPQGRRIGQLQLTDDLSILKASHTIKVGVNYRYNRVADTSYSQRSVAGTYQIYDLSEMVAGQLDGNNTGSFYQQRFATLQAAHIRLHSLGFYGQDEWKLSHNIMLTAGVRFDHNSNPYCVDNCFARLNQMFSSSSFDKGVTIPYNQSISTGLSNAFKSVDAIVIQPRVGLVISPSQKWGTVIRGGFGTFSDLAPGTLASSVFNNSPNVFTPSVRFGAIDVAADSGSSQAAAIATNAAFRSGFSNGSTLAQIQSALAPVAFTPPAYFSTPDNLSVPRFYEWSFEIQQPIGKKNILTVTYAGNHGQDLLLNNAKVNSYKANGFGGLPTTVPDGRFRIVTELTNMGSSNYNGLSVQFRRALTHGFTGQLSYTWSHSLDDSSNGGIEAFSGDSFLSANNPFNMKNNYGSSDYDIRHNVVADFQWEIPLKSENKALKLAFSGWTLGSKMFFRTGTPFTVYNSSLAGTVGNTTGGSILANVLDPNVNTVCGPSAVDTPCFTAASFSTTKTQTSFGNQTRNMFRAPGYADMDAQLSKRFAIREKMAFTIGATAMNLMNHPNFGSPSYNVAAGGLGLISSTVTAPSSPYGSFQGSAVSGRIVVLSGRFQF